MIRQNTRFSIKYYYLCAGNQCELVVCKRQLSDMIELRNLVTGYRSGGREKIVSRGVNATLGKGELTCLIGPNGIGKSTLLRTLASFQPMLEGEIIIGGRPASQLTSAEMSRLISVVLTNNTSICNLSAFDVVAMGRMPYTGFWGRLKPKDRHIVNECMGLVGVQHLAEQMIDTLSDGERQKTMIAKAIAQQTPVILLDEPTAFLFYPNKVAVMMLLRRLAHGQGKAILLSIHDIDLALQVADKVWLMDEKGNITVGTPAELCSNGMITERIKGDGIQFDAENRSFYVKV